MEKDLKDILFKDLCARLPYNTLISIDGNRYRMEEIRHALIGIDTYKTTIDDCDIEQVKPYLFPLSSMTEEQIYNSPFGYETMDTIRKNKDWTTIEIYHDDYYELVDWFNAHHFDYRNLIEKGLAIDATGLNIY